MVRRKIVLTLVVLFIFVGYTKAQIIGFRLAANSGAFITELGESDVPHPDALLLSPATSSETFTPQLSVGFEAELLFYVTDKSYFGIELDYSNFKGFNDDPPVFNYYLTPYFDQFQDELYIVPVSYNTTMYNLAVNYKYFFFNKSTFKPFLKLTGVVSFVGTDFTYKENPDPDLEWDVLYARGTSNSEQEKWPAFHIGGGLGLSYDISDRMSFQVDGTVTAINSGIINGVPNFTYVREDDTDLLKYNDRFSLTAQISVGLVYYFEIPQPSEKGGRGKTDSNLPFYRKRK